VAVAAGQRAALSPWALAAAPILLAAALAAPALVRFRPPKLWAILNRLLPGKARELAEIRLEWGQFGVFYATSLAAEILSILAVFCCLRAYGEIGLLTACALTPVVMLNNLVPLTPGGFGVRETLAVVVFGLVRTPAGAAVFPSDMILAGYLTNGLLVLVIPGAAGIAAAWVTGFLRGLKAAPAGEGER
jgi:uncharacterized membrane protein YbhN (UPF0104 family)